MHIQLLTCCNGCPCFTTTPQSITQGMSHGGNMSNPTCRNFGSCCACLCCYDAALMPSGAGLEALLNRSVKLSLQYKAKE